MLLQFVNGKYYYLNLSVFDPQAVYVYRMLGFDPQAMDNNMFIAT